MPQRAIGVVAGQTGTNRRDNKAQIARNPEEIPLELAAFPGKPLLKPPGHLKAAGRRLWGPTLSPSTASPMAPVWRW